MSENLSVSVIIPNRDRLVEIGRALKALKFQSHRNFEVIVVSNQVEKLTSSYVEMADVHSVNFDRQNISAARNAGIEAAAGDIIAFLDDDAVPEPTWLEFLIKPFDDPDVGAVGGLVRGRNGVSFQWGPQEVDCFGNDWPLSTSGDWINAPSRPDRVLKTVGTNCAFRASVVRDACFDEAYHFYLDETDLNWRLSKSHWKSVIVPEAEVHHGYAKSANRTTHRVPRSLKEIGASKAYFCKKFGDPKDVPQELHGFRKSQRNRLVRLMELGLLAPERIDPLMDTLEEGFIVGAGRTKKIKSLAKASRSFRLFTQGEKFAEPVLITTNLLTRRKSHRKARAKTQLKQQVTMFDFSHTAKMMTVKFTDEGYWLHKGGVFGRTDRAEKLFCVTNFRRKAHNELIRIAVQRKLRAFVKVS